MDRELMAAREARRLEYGLLLPHFGSEARRERLTSGLVEIEKRGFDSVWVRDHVVYHPHEHEDPDRAHVDPLVVLTAAAVLTRRLRLGTATLIPHRHPILAAGMLADLDFLAGGDRLIAGFGLGNYDHEFESVGMAGWDRRTVIEEYISILRRLWSGDIVSHSGEHYRFSDVQIRPVPTSPRAIPVWYGGGSPAAVRRSVEYCDGWLPSRIPMSVFRKRMDRLERLAAEGSTSVPDVGVVPLVVLGRTVEDAVRRLNLTPLIEATNGIYGRALESPAGTYEDLDGVAIAGPPEVVAEEVARFQDAGARHFIFDLRSTFDAWEESVAQLSEEVLPLLRSRRGPGPEHAKG